MDLIDLLWGKIAFHPLYIKKALPGSFGRNLERIGECCSCQGNLFVLWGEELHIAFCDNCGWLFVTDSRDGKKISRSVDSFQRMEVENADSETKKE